MEESLALTKYCIEGMTKLFEQRSDHILMTDDVVKRLNNAFVVVSEPVGVVVGCSHPEGPAL